MTKTPSIPTDQSIVSAWQAGVGEASRDENLKLLVQSEAELLPHFAEQYHRLTAMPRRMRRALQRHWKQSLAGIALLLALGQAPALAATISVNARCSLGQAITSTNRDVAVAGCARGNGPDRIVLPTGSTQTLRTPIDTPYGASGLVVRSRITIAGNGATVRRAPDVPDFRIFAVVREGDLTLLGTRVSGGVASDNSLTYGDVGGGLLNYYGSVTLNNAVVSGNRADNGTAVYGYRATTTINNSTISGNTGFFERSTTVLGYVADLRLVNSTVSGNRGNGVGANFDSSATVSNSTISNNSGTGVYSSRDVTSVDVLNSTISGNGYGGVSASNAAGLYLTHTTVTDNAGDGVIGGYDGGVFLNRTVVSGNSGAEVFAFQDRFAPGRVFAGDFNLFGHAGRTNAQAFDNFTPEPTDITATSNGNTPTALNAILNTNLANNGGPTRTHALPARSPAVDAVVNGTCPPPGRDQRGVMRPQDGNGDGGVACDIGSFERQ